MKPEQQRIAIATTCGWKRADGNWWVSPKDGYNQANPPDYLNDLNAMARARSTLKTVGEQGGYVRMLAKVCGAGEYEAYDSDAYKLVNATPAQHAEAFIRYRGIWRDE